MSEFDGRTDTSINAFLESLLTIAWFANIGRNVNGSVIRLSDWKDWPGPEADGVVSLHLRLQETHDSLEIDDHTNLKAAWDRIHDSALRITSRCLGIDPHAQDAWDPKSTACWQASWTAALIGNFELLKVEPPLTIKAQWNWFVAGHWPAGYTAPEDSSLMVL